MGPNLTRIRINMRMNVFQAQELSFFDKSQSGQYHHKGSAFIG
jgi:hypothetical protein